VKILDTRKTTPGLRWLEKKAVIHGGGSNHRMGLYDMVLIKDNHIAAAGGVDGALKRVARLKCPIEIEVSNFDQLKKALNYTPDIVMLDNFTTGQIKKAVRLVKSTNPKIKLEVSGGVNLKNVRSFAETGVDYISIGALTHSASAADFSMRYSQ
jgi:nicotinate-nucleotide pyrophosphorylase (carboxylating)